MYLDTSNSWVNTSSKEAKRGSDEESYFSMFMVTNGDYGIHVALTITGNSSIIIHHNTVSNKEEAIQFYKVAYHCV